MDGCLSTFAKRLTTGITVTQTSNRLSSVRCAPWTSRKKKKSPAWYAHCAFVALTITQELIIGFSTGRREQESAVSDCMKLLHPVLTCFYSLPYEIAQYLDSQQRYPGPHRDTYGSCCSSMLFATPRAYICVL